MPGVLDLGWQVQQGRENYRRGGPKNLKSGYGCYVSTKRLWLA